jgi:CRISPR system Cascade subunit CasE
MIASVYRLSRSDLKALKITDAYSLHRAVYSLFPKIEGETRDFLFADKGGDFLSRQILLLSHRAPVNPEFGTVESKNIPETFLMHDYYGFEVTINPVKRESATGKTLAIKGKDNLLTWFAERAPSFGFTIEPESLSVQNIGVQQFEKDGATVTHGTATFIGKFSVADRIRFIESFQKGIGRAKGFGFGLLQIVPLVKSN